MSRLLTLALSAAFSLACTGTLLLPEPDGGRSPTRDAGQRLDAGPERDAGPRTDAGPIDVDGGSTGADAGPNDAGYDAGYDAGFDSGPPVMVGPCDVGYEGEPGMCTPVVSDPATRPRADVCTVWNAGNMRDASGTGWSEGADTCDIGTLQDEAIFDTLRMVNTYRWLSGLPPASYDHSWFGRAMECALMMHRNGALNHHPPTDWDCYTSGGDSAAGSSNLSLGYSHGPAGVTGQMWDRNTASLGHRRWILSPNLGQVGIGVAGRALCLRVFDGSGATDRTWTAYPNEGFAPIENAGYAWSVQMSGASFRDASITVTRRSDGMNMPVEGYIPGSTYGRWPSYGWNADGWTPEADETYDIRLENHGSTRAPDPLEYEVTLIDC